MTTFPFTNGIDIEKFDETYCIISLKETDYKYKGITRIDMSGDINWIIVYTDHVRVWIDFNEVELLRWPMSGLVRDHYFDVPGTMHHVPELYETRI